MRLLILTQCHENYAWTEDGELLTGDKAYWKAKGGSEYLILGLTPPMIVDIMPLLEAARKEVEIDNEGFREFVVGWQIVEDDFVPMFELDQIEFDGKITYPVKRFSADQLLSSAVCCQTL